MLLRKRSQEIERALLDAALLLLVLRLLVCKGCVFTETRLREVDVVVMQ